VSKGKICLFLLEVCLPCSRQFINNVTRLILQFAVAVLVRLDCSPEPRFIPVTLPTELEHTMAPKNPKTPEKTAVPDMNDASSLTQENFEKELKDLKAKAQQQTTFRSVMGQVAIILSAIRVLGYAAVYSNVSQYTLSPVYGAIPSGIWHSRLVMTTCFIGWSANLVLKRILPKKYSSPFWFIPVVAWYIPFIQFLLFKLSGYFGATYGPVITEGLTFAPLLLLSAASTAEILEDLDLSKFPSWISDALPGMLSWLVYRACETFSNSWLTENIGSNIALSRVGLQFILNASYFTMAPSMLLVLAVPGLFHTVFMNPHLQTPWATYDLEVQLKRNEFRLLHRQDSLTGYLSVIENTKEHFRVMRCDHSLLGGEWLPAAGGPQATLHEPIYGVFAMLEAVRLVEVDIAPSDFEESALVM
jgi:hypothetical protein